MESKRQKVCHDYVVNSSPAKISKTDQDSGCKLSKSKPGLLQNVFENSDICEKIFLLLDDNDLRACRLVCHSWKSQVDYPYFKIKLSKQIGISEELQDTWIELIKHDKMPLCKKWHGKYWTPLHVAVPNHYGWTPLQRAAQYGSTETFKFLAPQVENPNATNPFGWTALHIAARNGCTEIFKFLAPQVENPNAPCPEGMLLDFIFEGWTALHIAAKHGSTEIFKFLAPQVENPNAPNPNGYTALIIAAQNGSTEIFKFLAPQVENPNAPCPEGRTALHIAAQHGSTEIFKFLAPQVEKPNAPGPGGGTPLHFAARYGYTEIFKFLAPQVTVNEKCH